MEQETKDTWNYLHLGDSNPYDELPKIHFFTYDHGDGERRHDKGRHLY